VAQASDWFTQHGVGVAVVSFADPARLKDYQAQFAWPFRLLADPQRTAYTQLGLGRLGWARLINLSTIWRYVQLIRLGRRPRYHRGDDVRQAGGDFLLDKTGRIHWAWRGRHPADRPTVRQIQSTVGRVLAKA
jgi:peroxiredoxin